VRDIVVKFVLLIVVIGTLRNSEAQSPTSLIRSGSKIRLEQTGVDKSSPQGSPCMFDFERGELPNCILKSAAGDLSIAPQFLKDLEFDSAGLAAVRSATQGWMYVNHKGKVIIRGVPVMDNWADTFHDGLVRFVRNNKYGFANRSGRTVIPPIYDGAMNFEKGNAEVCKGCASKCADPDCEYHVFSGGSWFLINTNGAIRKRIYKD
jgi:hypothetical protein